MPTKKNILLFFCLFLMVGCSVGPDYKKQKFQFTSKPWGEQSNQNGLFLFNTFEDKWWETFEDDILNMLIQKAVKSNLDIQIAQKNLERANALISQARSALFFNVDFEGAVTRRKISENSGIPVGAANPLIQNFYSQALVANWELDIFGGARRELYAAYARYHNIEEQKHDAVLLVLFEVCNNYIELRKVQKQFAIVQKYVELLKKRNQLIQKRLKKGESSQSDFHSSQIQLQSGQARLPNLKNQMNQSINKLSVLTGQPPEALYNILQQDNPLPDIQKNIPVGLRSDLLRRRPDIRAVERLFEAEVQDIGAVKADLFPKFTLSGAVGLESIGSAQFLSSSSGIWSLGPSIRWPVFNAGRIMAQVNVEKIEASRAFLEYKNTILLALEDVENSLIAFSSEYKRRGHLMSLYQLQKKNYMLAQKRTKKGLDSLITLIDNHLDLLNAEEEFVLSKAQALVNLLRLYRSLGGGWNVFASND